MAGTIPLSMTQQFDVYGKPLAGGLLYIIQVGTVSTPQNAYQDSGLTIAHTYPMVLDAAGRVPQFFLADGSVKIRLQDVSGVVQLASDSVLVIGASSGGGGGATVDPTQLIQTGNMIFRHSTGALTGYVRLNDLTIGSATSGATERANADTQALFLYLWPDTALTVSGSRGASAAADWTANKTIKLPDWRGYAISGLDDMGNSASGRLTAAYFGTAATVLGAAGGNENIALATVQLPIITPTTASVSSILTLGNAVAPVRNFAAGGASDLTKLSLGSNIGTDAGAINLAVTGTITTTITMSSFGGGQPHRTVGPRQLVTFYMKL